MQDLVKLVDIISTFEEGSTTEELGKNTSNRPDINLNKKMLLEQFLPSHGRHWKVDKRKMKKKEEEKRERGTVKTKKKKRKKKESLVATYSLWYNFGS